jgi:TolB-like protein
LEVEGRGVILDSRNLIVNSNHETVFIEVLVRGGYSDAKIQNMKIFQSTPLPDNQAEEIEQAIIKSFEQLINNIPQNSIVAVINISSRDIGFAEYFIDEITYLLVNSKKCRVIERNTLDAIRTEQNFQMSGDVDDDHVISIGKMIGANVVITGTISGSGQMRRLRLKALDVRTAEIIAMSSESF